MTDFMLVYVTVPQKNMAEHMARSAVESGLAACANLWDGALSVYKWDGVVRTDRECILVLKTRAALFDALAAHIRTLHSSICPCIVGLPLAAGTQDFLNWIRDNTSAQPS